MINRTCIHSKQITHLLSAMTIEQHIQYQQHRPRRQEGAIEKFEKRQETGQEGRNKKEPKREKRAS